MVLTLSRALLLSFQHVRSCSVNFTLRNYTVEIDNEAALELSYDDAESYIEQGKVRLKLNSTSLPSGVGLDSSHQLAIAVCHDVTCKSSNPVNFCKWFHLSNLPINMYPTE